MDKKTKFIISSDFVYAENKQTYISLIEGNDNLYQISGAGTLIAKKLKSLKSFDMEVLHGAMSGIFEVYGDNEREMTEEFIRSLIGLSILVKVTDS